MELSNDILYVKIRGKYRIGNIVQNKYGYKKFKEYPSEKEIDLSGIEVITNFREEHKLYEISEIQDVFPEYFI